jgi:hypothetical protein
LENKRGKEPLGSLSGGRKSGWTSQSSLKYRSLFSVADVVIVIVVSRQAGSSGIQLCEWHSICNLGIVD